MICIVVPVLKRPHRVLPTIQSVRDNTTVPYRLLFVATAGDDEEIATLRMVNADFVVEPRHGVGDYAFKINRGYRESTEPYIFTGADDLSFHPGWDTAALAKMEGSIGVVGTQDRCNRFVLRGEHSTHSLVSRAYADRLGVIDKPGAILAECYPHEYVDNELVATAKARGAWAFAEDSVVEHLHPCCGKAPTDPSYDRQSRRMAQGRPIFNRRAPMWGNAKAGREVPVSVIVATFGDEKWKEMAEVAATSARAQTSPPAEVICVHGKTLASARNEGAEQALSPWLCFLDADDTLDRNYFRYMAPHMVAGRVLVPAAAEVLPNGRVKKKVFAVRDLSEGNWIVLGALVERERFLAAGGFEEEWNHWEDWQMWRKVMHLGAEARKVPGSIYRVTWRADSRHRTVADPRGELARMQASFDQWASAL